MPAENIKLLFTLYTVGNIVKKKMKNQKNLYSYAPGSRPELAGILTFNNYQSIIMLATLYQQPSFNNLLLKEICREIWDVGKDYSVVFMLKIAFCVLLPYNVHTPWGQIIFFHTGKNFTLRRTLNGNYLLMHLFN